MPTNPTPIAELRRLLRDTVVGPWRYEGDCVRDSFPESIALTGKANGEFIVALVNNAEWLLDAAAESATLRADILEIALAIGIAYEPDSGPCAPGPTDAIVRAIKQSRRDAGETHELRARVAKLEAALLDIDHWADAYLKPRAGMGGDLPPHDLPLLQPHAAKVLRRLVATALKASRADEGQDGAR